MSGHQAHRNVACPSCEFILDIHFQGDITHIWTKKVDGSTHHYPLFYHPQIYIAADSADDQYANDANRNLDAIFREISGHPNIVDIRRVNRYLGSNDDTTTEVLQVSVYSPQRLQDVVMDFKDKALNMYNIDLNIRQQFFLDLQCSPMMACHITTSSFEMREYLVPDGAEELDHLSVHGDPTAIYYPIPPLRLLDISVEIAKQQTFPTYDDPIAEIVLTFRRFGQKEPDNIIKLDGSEAGKLLKLVHFIDELDPDFLNIVNGDKFVMNYLAHRAAYHQITDQFVLGRLPTPTYPRREQTGQTYMSYGQIRRREAVWYLPGRVHIDAENSFFMYESGVAGLIDLARMAGVPPERTARSSIGTALTGIEFKVNSSTLPPTLVPPNKATGEQFKGADHLLISDNGGLIYPAQPGVHDRVWAIDFTSLYPMIMAIHNIGNETILCDHKACKEDDPIIVPEVGYHVCRRRVGVVPRTMYLVLQKRLMLKMSKRKAIDEKVRDRLKGIDSAMKWILVSCFGYLGFKNARWGSIESHQCVTAYARRYLLRARQICENHGFEVIAGITDSLFIRAKDPADDTVEIVQQIIYETTRSIGIPLDLEGKFNWVVFGSIREYHEVAALNRYFGYFSHDEFKLRGIKHRQRRAIPLELEFQEKLLEHFKPAMSKEEFYQLLPSSYDILEEYIGKLENFEIDADRLVMKLKTGRGAAGYRATSTVQALATKRYEILGYTLHPGMNFFFVVIDDSRRDIDRLRIGPEIDSTTTYDPSYYITLLNRDYLELTEDAQRAHYGNIRYSSEGIERSLDEFEMGQDQHTRSEVTSFDLLRGSRQQELDDFF